MYAQKHIANIKPRPFHKQQKEQNSNFEHSEHSEMEMARFKNKSILFSPETP
jgi:hypothetical protein